MAKLTVVRGGRDWEAVYVDGDVIGQNHIDRLWPGTIVDVVDEHDIDSAERISASMCTDDEGRMKATRFPSTLDELYESDDYEVN